MAIKIAPIRVVSSTSNAMTTPIKTATTLTPAKRNVRKPSGNAKEAVTLRLSKECIDAFTTAHGIEWRTEMQAALEKIAFPKA